MTTWSLSPLGFEAELDTLEIRLRTLDPFVDVHVIAESTVTYAGVEKPLHYAQHLERFEPWWEKIRYVVVDDAPEGDWGRLPDIPFSAAPNARWARENHQRNALIDGCHDMDPGDLVLLSDLDEIPSRAAWAQAPAYLEYCDLWRPALSLHVGYLNWRWPDPVPVIARFMRGHTLHALGPQGARLVDGTLAWPPHGQPSAFGWHLSYLGGPGAIAHKIRQAAHAELDRPEFTDEAAIAKRLATGADLFDRPDRQAQWVDVDQLPACVAAGGFDQLLCAQP